MIATRRARTALATVVALLLGLAVWAAEPVQAQAPPAERASVSRNAGWVQVSSGARHTCGLKITGRLFCWGSDAAGQVGDGGTKADQLRPVEVAGGIRNWASVSAGGTHTCGITRSGALYCWGSDFHGQRGDGGTNTDVTAPVAVPGSQRWAQVSAGTEHTCAIARGGRLYCWGNDGSGRLGDDAAIAGRTSPVEVAGARTDWRSVSAGFFHTCAVQGGGRLWCWGLDSAGQLGDDATLANRAIPTEVAGRATNWAKVSVGTSHTCALKRSGQLFCWGWDAHGQLGDDAAHADRATPVAVAGGDTRWTEVSLGGWTTCATGSTGRFGWARSRVQCWGLDTYGGLGNDDALVDQPLPVAVAQTSTPWSGLDAGEYHGCALASWGRLWCWGLGANGLLGTGDTDNRPTPVPVLG